MKAFIILGQMLNDDGSMISVLKRRLEKLLRVYDGESLIITVGGRANKKSPFSEADVMKEYLVSRGVPNSLIIEEERSLDTIGNFFFLKRDILKKRKIVDLVIITSNFHMSRTKIICKKIFGGYFNVRFVPSHDLFDFFVIKLVISGIEKKLTAIISDMLSNIEDGNDRQIVKMLGSHPFYSKRGFGKDIKGLSNAELAELLGVKEVNIRPIRKYLDARISQTK